MADLDRLPDPTSPNKASSERGAGHDSATQLTPSPSTFVKVIVVLLLLVGVQFWLIGGQGIYGRELHLVAIAAIALLMLMPPIRRTAARTLAPLRQPSVKVRTLIAVGVAIISGIALFWTAKAQGRAFYLYIPDEFCYSIQTHMIAQGRLWMPAHPLGEAFENFYLLHEPKYAAMYFPGSAMLLAPFVWLHLPLWLAPLTLASAIAGFLYRITTELLDGLSGIVAAMLLVSVPTFRWLSLRVMSPMPVMLMGLLMVWAYLNWRRSVVAGSSLWKLWAIVLGVAAGWGAICRPLDALCYALPIGALMLVDLFRATIDRKRFMLTAIVVLVGAAPLLSIQLIANKGITGKWSYAPYRLYHDRDAPGSGYGFSHYDANAKPQSVLPQKHAYYSGNIAPTIRDHRSDRVWQQWVESRLPLTAQVTTPHRLVLALLPLGLFAMLRRRELWSMGGVAIVLPAMFAPFTFFLPHYAVPAGTGIALLAVAAVHQIATTFPRAGTYWSLTLLGALAVLSLTSWKAFNRVAFDDPMSGITINALNDQLARIPEPQALVLFRFSEKRLVDAEPVYNADVAWPDDARIIRANELSPELTERTVRYYAERTPNRMVYRYDEGTGELTKLATAEALATSSTGR